MVSGPYCRRGRATTTYTARRPDTPNHVTIVSTRRSRTAQAGLLPAGAVPEQCRDRGDQCTESEWPTQDIPHLLDGGVWGHDWT
jgi:hypothetical protein